MPEPESQASIGAPELGEYMRPQYANTVNCNFTPWDFQIIFSLLTAPVAPPKSGSKTIELRPTAVADVVVPASVMHALITLLQRQFNLYLSQYGAPGMNPEGPQSPGAGDEGLGNE